MIVYYPDLTCYRIDTLDGSSLVFPNLRNIGWLEKRKDYNKGEVPDYLIRKLERILFLDKKNDDDRNNGSFDEKKAILVHTNFVIGSPHKCEFCGDKEISIPLPGLQDYSTILGINEIHIPSLKENEFFVFPTMLYHYVVDHRYVPPRVFLDALEAFDVEKPFNVNTAYGDEIILKIPNDHVNVFVPELEDFSNYIYDDDDE